MPLVREDLRSVQSVILGRTRATVPQVNEIVATAAPSRRPALGAADGAGAYVRQRLQGATFA